MRDTVPATPLLQGRSRLTLAFLLAGLWACAEPPAPAPPVQAGNVSDARLRAAGEDTANWLSHGRTYAEQRYSPLAQIDGVSTPFKNATTMEVEITSPLSRDIRRVVGTPRCRPEPKVPIGFSRRFLDGKIAVHGWSSDVDETPVGSMVQIRILHR